MFLFKRRNENRSDNLNRSKISYIYFVYVNVEIVREIGL